MDTDRMAGAAKSTFGKAEKAAGGALGDTRTQAEGAAKEAQGVVQNTIGQVKDAARDAADVASSAAESAYGAGADMVAERPASALLIAGMVGFALGVVFARSSQPPRRPRWQRIYDYD